MKRYKPLFENEIVTELGKNRNGVFTIILETIKNGQMYDVSELTYSENPNIGYTQDKNSEDYIYIEWVETPSGYRGQGYASQLLDYLVKKYKHKKIIAHTNSLSTNIVKKYNIIEIDTK